MKTKTIVLTVVIAFFTLSMNAQTIKPGEKSKSYFKFLDGVEQLKVEFVYADDMKVGKLTEKEYVEKKKEEYNKKEAGRGDKWSKMWFEDREKRFEPKFIDLFNKGLAKKDVMCGYEFDDAKYTMIVTTTWTEPGYYIGISSRPSYINGVVSFVETAKPDKVLAEIKFFKSPGNAAAAWDTGERIKESYAKLGKEIAAFLKKKAF